MKLLTRHRTTRSRRGARTMSAAAALAALALLGATPASAANSAMAWGNNDKGQLGNGTATGSDIPLAVSGLSGVSGIAAGADHSLASIESTGVVAWGDNQFGQLGTGTTSGSAVPVGVPVQWESVSPRYVYQLAAGAQHSLIYAREGADGLTKTVYGAGNDEEGEVGDQHTETPHLLAEVIKGLGQREVVSVAAGSEHSLAVTKTGAVYAFGSNAFGQLGLPEEEVDEPKPVSGVSNAVAVAAGNRHSLALLSNGTVLAWGNNQYGQLGNGNTESSNSPVPVVGLSGVKAIAAGGEHSLALLANGTVMAWGDDEEGQLGNGANESSDVPVAVSELSGVSAIAAGGEHSLALRENGSVMAWGTNDDGQLGDGELQEESSNLPVEVSGLSGVRGIAAGEAFSLAYGEPQAPAVASVSPQAGPPSGGSAVRITGSNLNLASAVHFGSASASFTVDSTTVITAVAPAGTGVVDVTVTSGGGTSATSAADRYSYLPTVTAVAPNEGLPSGGSEVAITGTNFTGASAVKFGSTAALKFTVTSDTSIAAIVPPGTGTVDVSVTAPGGTSATSSADHYSYVLFPPVVTGVNPKEGPAQGRSSVTITGTDMYAATAVHFGAANATSFTVNSESSISAVSPPGTGTVDVTVTTAAGTSAATPADQFTYVPPATVTSVQPTEGPDAGGTWVRINGAGLEDVTEVKFGSTSVFFEVKYPEGLFTLEKPWIEALAPPGSGTVDVTVVTPEGTSPTSSADQFSYRAPPTVTKLEPREGPQAGKTPVLISGTNFNGVSEVDFGSTRAVEFRVLSATSLAAVSPAGTGAVHVTVRAAGGTSSTTAADEFTYLGL
jgi:alpha-tubulin suppressor-like RCC1 family protein